jgi:hypothetical protein
MAWTRAALALVAAGAVGVAVVSGGSGVDPRTPAGLPGLPAPFLGTAVVGDGRLTAAIDAYGDVVDLRAPGPAGRALIDNPAARQAAGSVPAGTGIVPQVSFGGGPARPLWRADSVSQRYLPGTNVLRTTARFGRVGAVGRARGGQARGILTSAAAGGALAEIFDVVAPAGVRAAPRIGVDLEARAGGGCRSARRSGRLILLCSGPAGGDVAREAEALVRRSAGRDRRWLDRARPLGRTAPGWARRMYRRSLLTLRSLTDGRTGAVAAGARDGWAYVWPRDAATATLAFAAAGYPAEARRAARFLRRVDLGAAARFYGDGAPVPGRAAQGDAAGWVTVAARAVGIPPPTARLPWRDRPDYQEGTPGDYLANAIAHPAEPAGDGPERGFGGDVSANRRVGIATRFGTAGGLVRSEGEPKSGLDSAAAWAVRPFPRPVLFSAARRTLIRLAARQTRFGITPGAAWPGVDPWMAPTAWSAWSLAALGDRDAALRLIRDLRRAATPAGELPERVDARTGVPRSTTPLAWSHAFAILALRELWP